MTKTTALCISTILTVCVLSACTSQKVYETSTSDQAPQEARATDADAGAVAQQQKTRANSQLKSIAPSIQPAPSRPSPADKPVDISRLPIVQNESVPEMYFKHYGVNPTIDTLEEAKSTFSVDVDDASFAITRAYLDSGALPPEDAVRVEEFVNALDYGYATNADKESLPFSIQAEIFPSPYRKGYHVMHLGLKGAELDQPRQPANLVFVVDVSGSMNQNNRMNLLKRALGLLVKQLQPNDSVAIVEYNQNARIRLKPTRNINTSAILNEIQQLHPSGSTNAAAGLALGYELAERNYSQDKINRVILCSDGVANVGTTSPDGILNLLREKSDRGIYLTTVGFGLGHYNDTLMEQLANHANGSYHYVDNFSQATRIFKEQLTGTLQVIAQDAKIQVEFDPTAVERYRLIGYENRALPESSFANDRVDAGEVGAGHSVTALYELKLRNHARPGTKIHIRAKRPGETQSRLLTKVVPSNVIRDSFQAASSPAKLSLAVSAFAEKLRGSYWTRNVSYSDIKNWYSDVNQTLRLVGVNAELKRMLDLASTLDERPDKFAREVSIEDMQFDHVPIIQ